MIRTALCCLLLSAALAAQEFEVASIRPSALDQPNQVSVGLRISGSQMRISYFSLKDYIAMAYAVKPHQISGPEWLAQMRFDIAGKIPDGSSAEQIPQMLQKLLTDRFQLKTHRETREAPVYAMGVAKDGLKIEPLPPLANADSKPGGVEVAAAGNANGVAVDMGGGSSFRLANNQIEIRRMTMTQIAEMLTRFVDRPVVDLTGKPGQFDITLQLTPEDYTALLIRSAVAQGLNLPPQALRMLEGASNDQLSAPLQKVGLTFEARRAPLEYLVVDSILRAPTEN